MHRIGHWTGGDRIHFNCIDCPFEWSEMIIRYDWNYCDSDEDHKSCIRGSREECPIKKTGIEEYCQHFHIEKEIEDVER
jgi:hypothetical protein